MASFINQQEDVVGAFKAVRTSTYNLNGGVGNLGGAVDALSQRISDEEQNKANAEEIRNKSNQFLDLAIRVDKQVAVNVKKNREEFYQVHPWLRPPVPEEDKPWYEKAWDFLCDTVEDVVEGVKQGWETLKEFVGTAWEAVKSTVKSIWTSIKTWVSENFDKIILGALAIISVIVTGILMATFSGLALVLIVAAFSAGMNALSSGLENMFEQLKANGGDWKSIDWGAVAKDALVGAAVGAITGIVGAGIGSLAGDFIKSLSFVAPHLNSSIKAISVITKFTIGSISEAIGGIFSRFSGSVINDVIEDGDYDGDTTVNDVFYHDYWFVEALAGGV